MGNSTFIMIILINENKELLIFFFRPYTNMFDISYATICESDSHQQTLYHY
jgi:hypothetical protein